MLLTCVEERRRCSERGATINIKYLISETEDIQRVQGDTGGKNG